MTEQFNDLPEDQTPQPMDVRQYWETFTGKVFRPITIIKDALTLFGLGSQGSVQVGQGADIASAGSIVLGNGNLFGITGTTKISTIAPKLSVTPMILKFASALCQVEDRNLSGSGNIYLLQGHFYSPINGILSLYSDGTNWHEINRSAWPRVSMMVSRQTALSIPNNTSTTVAWDRYPGAAGGGGASVGGDEFNDTPAAYISLDSSTHKEISLLVPGSYSVSHVWTWDPSAIGRRKSQIGRWDATNGFIAFGDGNEMGSEYWDAVTHPWTNNITAGGTTDQTTDYSDTANYDAGVPETRAHIRNNLYQIARKVGKLADDTTGKINAQELTTVGATIVRSDGTNRINMNVFQNSGAALNGSVEWYECHLLVYRIGD